MNAIAWLLAVLLTAASSGETASLDDERAVTSAALLSHFNLVHGGTGVAFPEHRRPVLLHRTTIVPSRDHLRVRVSSPANRDATLLYSGLAAQGLVEGLRIRSSRTRRIRSAPAGFALAEAEFGGCGPEFDDATFADAIAVSRPAFEDRKSALIYLEHAGGARAYHATMTDGVWRIDWHVELWACG